MGMFDRIYAPVIGGFDDEWQTKAYHCALVDYRVGDAVPTGAFLYPADHQVEIIGGPDEATGTSHALVRSSRLVAVNVPRDKYLPLVAYEGGVREDAYDPEEVLDQVAALVGTWRDRARQPTFDHLDRLVCDAYTARADEVSRALMARLQ